MTERVAEADKGWSSEAFGACSGEAASLERIGLNDDI